jgi:hypothetical protein
MDDFAGHCLPVSSEGLASGSAVVRELVSDEVVEFEAEDALAHLPEHLFAVGLGVDCLEEHWGDQEAGAAVRVQHLRVEAVEVGLEGEQLLQAAQLHLAG